MTYKIPNWYSEKVRNFHPAEFPEWIGWAEPELFFRLDVYREVLGCRVYPSPVKGALARFEWGDRFGQHYCDRTGPPRSKAVDVFCDCSIFHAYTQALACQLWGGVGVYFDTRYSMKQWPMLHLDIREKGHRHKKEACLIWFRDKGEYVYPQYNQREASRFMNLLNASAFSADR